MPIRLLHFRNPVPPMHSLKLPGLWYHHALHLSWVSHKLLSPFLGLLYGNENIRTHTDIPSEIKFMINLNKLSTLSPVLPWWLLQKLCHQTLFPVYRLQLSHLPAEPFSLPGVPGHLLLQPALRKLCPGKNKYKLHAPTFLITYLIDLPLRVLPGLRYMDLQAVQRIALRYLHLSEPFLL